MSQSSASNERSLVRRAIGSSKDGLRVIRQKGPSQIQFWFIALIIGIFAGFAALFFRKGVEALEATIYGHAEGRYLHELAAELSWYWLLIVPAVGGLLTGLILHNFTRDGRARSVADVIEGSALYEGRVEKRAGMASAFASLITLGTGGSSGREGPVVHLGGVISSWICRFISADGITGRDLLGCAVAAAVSASFNAPIAGALFALEVILRHFAVHAFAPIVIASAAGTVINRIEYGGVTEFALPTNNLTFYVELPAFLLLGIVSGVVAVALMRSVFFADDLGTSVQNRIGLPRYLRPAIAGLMLGALAIYFPHIIGVGYGATSQALTGDLLLWEAIVFTALKITAVAITLGGRMGGGIFSPSLMIGAMTGLAFGILATMIYPAAQESQSLYALAGMGAVAAAVLGAPISTTLIVFELTGDWQTGLAVMVSVSLSTAIASKLVDRSFFLTQLERRGVHVAAGPQAYLLSLFRVQNIMRGQDDEYAPSEDLVWKAIEAGCYVGPDATLEDAMPVFDKTGRTFIAVAEIGAEGEPPKVHGTLFHVDALKKYNQALAATAAEEHS